MSDRDLSHWKCEKYECGAVQNVYNACMYIIISRVCWQKWLEGYYPWGCDMTASLDGWLHPHVWVHSKYTVSSWILSPVHVVLFYQQILICDSVYCTRYYFYPVTCSSCGQLIVSSMVWVCLWHLRTLEISFHGVDQQISISIFT